MEKKLNQGYHRCPLSRDGRTSQGQGAIEYLLIIGAAVIIAVIVISLMMGLAGQGTGAVQDADVSDIYHDLKVSLRGYEIDMYDSSWANGTAADVKDRCSAINTSSLCSWPIKNPEEILINTSTGKYDACLDTKAEVVVRFEDLESGEVTTETINLTGVDTLKTFKVNYKGDPNNNHNLKVMFTDCCQSSNGTNYIGCNIGSASTTPYRYDKNMRVDVVRVKNSDGSEVANRENPGCSSSSMAFPCYDIDFQ